MTPARIVVALLVALDLAACGTVSGTGASTSASTRATSSSTAVTGCAVAIIDAGTCTSYGTCVSGTVTGSCKSTYATCYASGGPCSAFVACTASCDCSNSACVSACMPSMSSACNDCLQSASNCSENACSAQIAQCLVGINDAATHNCVDLANCCGSLPSNEVSASDSTVMVGNDAFCSTVFATVGCR